MATLFNKSKNTLSLTIGGEGIIIFPKQSSVPLKKEDIEKCRRAMKNIAKGRLKLVERTVAPKSEDKPKKPVKKADGENGGGN